MLRNFYQAFIIIYLLIIITGCKGRFYKASSGSMEKTIMMGKSFFVNNADVFKRDDIVVFDYFGNDYLSSPDENGKFKQHWEKRFYRIAGISGDSLQIIKGDLFVNNQYTPPPKLALIEYDIFSKVSIDDFPVSENMPAQITEENGIMHYMVQLTKEEAGGYLQRKPAVVDVKKIIREYSANDTFIIKPCVTCLWSVDNFGPLRIPLPGESIIVDSRNFKLYRNIPGIQMGKNIIKEKLYFLMGDNRHGAEDSRFIGYIAHSKINGIVK